MIRFERPKILDHRQAPPVITGLFCLLIFTLFFTLQRAGMLQVFELQVYDAWLQRMPDRQDPPKVLVIGITDNDIDSMKRTSPSDHELATLLTTLKKYK